VFWSWAFGLIFIANFLLKINNIIQVSIYATGTLEPLAQEGYIHEKIAYLNRDNISIGSAILNIITTIFLILLFSCFPVIFNVNVKCETILQIGTYSLIIVYILVLGAILKNAFTKKLIFAPWKIIMWTFIFVFLISMLGNYFYEIIWEIWCNQKFNQAHISLSFFLFIFIFGNFLYLKYYFFKLKIKKNSSSLLHYTGA
jgi:amino acid transporter